MTRWKHTIHESVSDLVKQGFGPVRFRNKRETRLICMQMSIIPPIQCTIDTLSFFIYLKFYYEKKKSRKKKLCIHENHEYMFDIMASTDIF